MTKKTFKLPVTWEVCGTVEIEAESLEQAILDFQPQDTLLPVNAEYVDGSFRLTDEDPENIKVMTE